ncbi:hypothetical protein KC338_g177 [Hortaea werneckii]|nr:hypothetical protein KC338_g177 [Hortaea werneckii]
MGNLFAYMLISFFWRKVDGAFAGIGGREKVMRVGSAFWRYQRLHVDRSLGMSCFSAVIDRYPLGLMLHWDVNDLATASEWMHWQRFDGGAAQPSMILLWIVHAICALFCNPHILQKSQDFDLPSLPFPQPALPVSPLLHTVLSGLPYGLSFLDDPQWTQRTHVLSPQPSDEFRKSTATT